MRTMYKRERQQRIEITKKHTTNKINKILFCCENETGFSPFMELKIYGKSDEERERKIKEFCFDMKNTHINKLIGGILFLLFYSNTRSNVPLKSIFCLLFIFISRWISWYENRSTKQRTKRQRIIFIIY